METPAPLHVVVCLTSLIDGLFEAVCARYGVFPIRGPLVRFLWKRLFRVRRHFACLAARFAAGMGLSPRPSRPRGARTPRRPADDQAFRLTRWVDPKFGWLCRIASGSVGASAFAWSLRELLTTDPEMQALLEASPATARILRPLCWMLGVALPSRPVVLAAALPEPLPEPKPAPAGAAPDAVAAIPRTAASPAPRDAPAVVVPVFVLKAA